LPQTGDNAPFSGTPVFAPIISRIAIFGIRFEILLMVRARLSFLFVQRALRTVAMIETVTAFFGFISASIFHCARL